MKTWGEAVTQMSRVAESVQDLGLREELRRLIDRFCQVCTQAHEKEGDQPAPVTRVES